MVWTKFAKHLVLCLNIMCIIQLKPAQHKDGTCCSSYRHIALHGATANMGWARGIYTFQVSQQSFDDIAYTGVIGTKAGIGIEIAGTHGTNEAVAHVINNMHATFFGTALKIDDGVQGVQVAGMNPVFGNIDIDWEVPAGEVEDGLSVTGS